MSSSNGAPRRRWLWRTLLSAAAGALLVLGALAWFVTTDSFQAMVRRRLVGELERATGGRVELGSFHTVPFRFEVDVRDLTIHGREQPGDVPYAHVDRLLAQVKLISVLGAEFGFHSLLLQRPVFHLIVYPDGTTNQPTPELTSAGTQIQRLFSLSIYQLAVRQGELLWNDQKIPLDFEANDVSASMSYSLIHRRYNGTLQVGKINTKFMDFRPVAWTTEARFELGEDGLVLNSLQASSGHSHLQATGRIVDFRNPSFVADYDLTVDMAELGGIARNPQMQRGTVQASGHGSWSQIVFSTNGTLQARDLNWRDPSFRVQASSLTGQFTVNPQRVLLENIKAKLFGGEATGDAQLINWRESVLATKASRSSQQRGIVHLRVKDFSAQEVAVALSSRARPLQRMNLAGLASGAVDTAWKGSPNNAESEITLDIVAPDRVRPDQVPLRAHTRATYRAAPAELEVKEFNASTRATQVRASGTFSTRAALNFSVATTNFGEWEDVLSAVGYQQFPFTMRGRASFNGTATGRLSEIDLVGKLQSQDFQVVIPASSTTQRRQLRWDSLASDIELSPHAFAAHNGTLHHAGAVIHFQVNAGLDQRQFTEASPFTANVQMRHADAAEILAIAGYNYALTGKLNLSLKASGTRASPAGQGWFQLSAATIRGEPVQQLEGRFALNRQELTLQEVHLTSNEGQIAGNGTYDFATRAFRLDINGQNFDLTRFPALESSRVAVQGSMDFVAQASGTPEEPAVNAKLHLRDLTFDHEAVGDYFLDASTKGLDLHVTGRSQFKDKQLNIDGSVQLRGDWPAKLDLHLSAMDLDSFVNAYSNRRVSGHTSVTADLQLQGPLRTPRDLQVNGNITDFVANLERVELRNNGPIRFEISQQMLNIQRFRLIGEGTDLEISGSAQLSGPQELRLNAEGHADLALIHSYNPDFNSSGTVAVNLMANGTLGHPTMQGGLQIAGGSVQYSDLPSALSDLNGSLIFNQDRLQVQTLTAHVGGGLVSFGGYATLYNGQLNFDLTLKAEDIRLRYPQGISSMSTSELRWAGTPAGSTLSGDATLTKLAITPGFDFSSYLQNSSQATALPQNNPLLSRIRMDVRITTVPQLQMQTAALTLSGDADLRLRGTAAKPVLLGRIDIMEGQVAFNGTKYRLERGGITFTNPVTTTPVLDLQALTRLRDYDITVNLNGEFNKLNMSYHSEPPLPTADIIGLLSPVGAAQQQFGQVQEQTAPSPFAQQASSAVLAEALNSALSNRSQRLFGISHIRIDPQGLNTATTPTQTSPLPAVTIEQSVRENITLSYTTDLGQTSQQIIQGVYNVTHNVSVVGIRDYNGVVSFELRLRRTKK